MVINVFYRGGQINGLFREKRFHFQAGGGGGGVNYQVLWKPIELVIFQVDRTPVPALDPCMSSSTGCTNMDIKEFWAYAIVPKYRVLVISVLFGMGLKSRPWGYTICLMFSSTEHEISTAHKKCCKIKTSLAFKLSGVAYIKLINVKMPIAVSISH